MSSDHLERLRTAADLYDRNGDWLALQETLLQILETLGPVPQDLCFSLFSVVAPPGSQWKVDDRILTLERWCRRGSKVYPDARLLLPGIVPGPTSSYWRVTWDQVLGPEAIFRRVRLTETSSWAEVRFPKDCGCGAQRRPNAELCEAQILAYDAGAFGLPSSLGLGPHLLGAYRKGTSDAFLPGTRAATLNAAKDGGS